MIRNPLFSGAVVAMLLSITMAACATGTKHAKDTALRVYGTQPDWVLTLRPDHWFTLDTNFAGHRIVAPVPKPQQQGTTRVWQTKVGDDQELTLTLEKKTCRDHSGDDQPYTAVVLLGDRTLDGCAHDL